jgi:hypothetical protein
MINWWYYSVCLDRLAKNFTKELAGPTATVFAGLVAVGVTGTFAWLQVRYTREKLRLDLFDRRLRF